MAQETDARLYWNDESATFVGGVKTAVYRQWASLVRCPNPVCGEDFNHYQATNDQLAIGAPTEETAALMKTLACPKCHIPVKMATAIFAGFDWWVFDNTRADIVVVIAPKDDNPTNLVKPIHVAQLDTLALTMAGIVFMPDYRRDDNIDERKLGGVASVANHWLQFDPNPMLELAGNLAEEVNQHTMAALIRGEAPQPQNTKYVLFIEDQPPGRYAFTFKLPMNAVLYAEMINRCGDPKRNGDFMRFLCAASVGEDIQGGALAAAGAIRAERVGEL